MIFYNKALLKKAGIAPENPPLSTHEEFLATSRTIVESGAAEAAIWPAPTSEFFQSWFDFSPMFAEGLSPKETFNGDSFAEGRAAMATVGPWAIAVYGEAVNWGVAPVPTSEGISPEETYTFSDAQNIGLYPDYFEQNPEYTLFADQASRTVEVPNVPNSIEIWQEFRDQWSSAVIFGKTSVDEALATAA